MDLKNSDVPVPKNYKGTVGCRVWSWIINPTIIRPFNVHEVNMGHW